MNRRHLSTATPLVVLTLTLLVASVLLATTPPVQDRSLVTIWKRGPTLVVTVTKVMHEIRVVTHNVALEPSSSATTVVTAPRTVWPAVHAASMRVIAYSSLDPTWPIDVVQLDPGSYVVGHSGDARITLACNQHSLVLSDGPFIVTSPCTLTAVTTTQGSFEVTA